MIVYDLGKNTVQKAVNAVADIFNFPVAQMNTKHGKKLKKSQGVAQMKEHLTYHTWNSQYELVKKILTVHKEIKRETEIGITDLSKRELTWEERYELLEGELEIMFHELEEFAKKKYKLQVDTSINAIKEKKAICLCVCCMLYVFNVSMVQIF